ncbi:hypothetical protein SEPCBS57363_005899 [Sporothrix epigloea]|uniref:Regulatory factor Sgt1 n=1 Tax=Sporothrix epigloea TaxID=1892477 RepID=A0ABP0E033_9PEZI
MNEAQRESASEIEKPVLGSLLYLHGETSYGDCIEDEWLIVYMLRHITKAFPGAWARISDNDGEFLLIEGAKAVPTWLTPDTDANRVWIHDGMLKLIPPERIKAADVRRAGTKAALTLADATRIIKKRPESLVHLPSLDEVAFRRLEKYPVFVTDALHYARLILPRKIAYILHSRPRAVACAVEAFLSRDPQTTRRIIGSTHSKTLLHFAPDDLVVISVKFTKTLYAQLRGQRFTPPKTWPVLFDHLAATLLLPEDKTIAGNENSTVKEKTVLKLDLSMKLTLGFEILAASAEKSNSRIVREIGLMLEDLAEDGDDSALLPSNDEIISWPDFNRESDDLWLNINFEDFERELDGNFQHQSRRQTTQNNFTENEPSESGFGDVNVQTDLRRIVSQFQSFLNDTDAGIDGADFGEIDGNNGNSDDEDDEDDEDGKDDDEDDSEDEKDGVSFNEVEFSRLLRESLGLPTTGAATMEFQTKSNEKHLESAQVPHSSAQDGGNGLDEEEEDILKLAAQFESELRGHGALLLSSPKRGRELKPSSLGKVITADGETSDGAPDSSLESDDEVDVDVNLVKNLLESFKGQEGMSGPAGNILSMLGLALPRDEDDEEECE